MSTQTNIAIENASADLSRLVQSVREGQEVVLTSGGQPVARIVPILAPELRPKAGYGKGTVLHMADDFDEPLEFDEEP